MTKLTEHFSLQEMCKTNVKGVSNAPDAKATANLYRVCGWLEELRKEWNNTYGDGNDTFNAEVTDQQALAINNEPLALDALYGVQLRMNIREWESQQTHQTVRATNIKVLNITRI